MQVVCTRAVAVGEKIHGTDVASLNQTSMFNCPHFVKKLARFI